MRNLRWIVLLLLVAALPALAASVVKDVEAAYHAAKNTESPARARLAAVERGLAAAAKPAPFEESAQVMLYKSFLLRIKAELAPAQADQLLAEANVARAEWKRLLEEMSRQTLAKVGWETWDVWIVQDGGIVFEEEGAPKGTLTLDRRPFSIHVMMPVRIQPVKLSASASAIETAGGAVVAEAPFNSGRNLVVDPRKTHHLDYTNANDHRYNRYRNQGDVHALERDVANLDGVPIEKSGIESLHLLLASGADSRRFVIRFR